MIPGFEGLYMVSNFGRVKSLNYRNTGKEEIMQTENCTDDVGHPRICLRKNGKAYVCCVHRLVAIAFIPIPEKYKGIPVEKLYVHHINFLPWDNRVENLMWLTKKEHTRLHQSIPVYQYGLDGVFIAEYPSQKDAERQTGIWQANINRCCMGFKNYNTVGGYQWRSFKTDRIPPCKTKNERVSEARSIPIEMCNMNWEHEAYFPSALECERQTGISHGNISMACAGKRKYTGKRGGQKHRFRYVTI